jgi:hypothetical protein
VHDNEQSISIENSRELISSSDRGKSNSPHFSYLEQYLDLSWLLTNWQGKRKDIRKLAFHSEEAKNQPFA